MCDALSDAHKDGHRRPLGKPKEGGSGHCDTRTKHAITQDTAHTTFDNRTVSAAGARHRVHLNKR